MHVLHPPKDLPTGSHGCSCRGQQFQTTNTVCANARSVCDLSAEDHHPRHLGYAPGHCACVAGAMCSDSGGRRMVGARETPSHRFEEGDRIGKGGSCDVFCGVEKGTGKRHALKVLRESSATHQSSLLKEADTLSQIKCPHIVSMHGLHFEVDTGRPVVVLEYCNGGSLHSFLLQPENARGLGDEEFLTLLRDLVEALSYLRGSGIVHRDIKPANILRHVHHSGKIEFKLSDFGTSREAKESDEMNSIVGTEEYLHPALYKAAFLGNQTHSAMKATSGELWSLGCTLYHAITASLPFRPLGGSRHNRKAMLVLAAQKPPGAISGHQRMDGTFWWDLALPNDCRMSESLRQKVVPLLQNLLETDSSRQWSFATFLDESQRILGMRSFHVCDTECGELFRLYMEPKQSIAELQDGVAYHTEIPAGEQVLFHRMHPLLSPFLGTLGPTWAQVADLPPTEESLPFLLLSPRRATEGRCRREVAGQPQLLVAINTLEEDVTTSFKACSDLYTHSLMALTFRRLPNLLFTAILALRSTLTSCQSTVETRFRVLSATCQERQSRMTLISQVLESLDPSLSSSSSSSASSSSSSSSSSGPSGKLNQARLLCDQLRDKLWKLKYRLDEFRRGGGGDSSRFDPSSLSQSLSLEESCESLTHLYGRAKEVWQRMQARRQKVPLSELEQDKHKGDRDTMNLLCLESTQRMKSLQTHKTKLLEHYRAQVRQLHERLETAQDMDLQLQKLKEESEHFSSLLDEIWNTEWEPVRKIVENSRHSVNKMVNPAQTSTPLHNQLGDLIQEGLPVLETFHLHSPEPQHK